MSGPMAHFNQYMMSHNDPNKWPIIRPEERMAVERGVYHWLHAIRQDLEQRDGPGDRIVADFLMEMQSGHGFLPAPITEQEAEETQKALFAGITEDQITAEQYEHLYDRLLGGRYDQTHPNGHDGDELSAGGRQPRPTE